LSRFTNRLPKKGRQK